MSSGCRCGKCFSATKRMLRPEMRTRKPRVKQLSACEWGSIPQTVSFPVRDSSWRRRLAIEIQAVPNVRSSIYRSRVSGTELVAPSDLCTLDCFSPLRTSPSPSSIPRTHSLHLGLYPPPLLDRLLCRSFILSVPFILSHHPPPAWVFLNQSPTFLPAASEGSASQTLVP
jgi:hypothetical protein